MRIVIDMQGAQSSGSRNRGIGRYTFSIAQAIIRNRGGHEVYLALNGLFPDSIESIRAEFDELLPQENIRVWQVPDSVSSLSSENDWRRDTAELIREAFLASLKPDIVLVSSLFEGLDDDAVTSVGTLAKTVPTAVILYDLIPLIQRQPYLENPVVEAWYENKLDHLRRADLLLAISESSRQESIRYLGFSAEACVNISTAADSHFQPVQVGIEREALVRESYGLLKPFVMYTGGIDHRKNIERLIGAYSLLPKPLRASHQLAIVCSIQPTSRATLEKLAQKKGLKADELVLTGFVPEEDLLMLYNLCKLFVFPSWHEGFGLPALEAMSCGRAVIGANTSSLPEVIGRDDALFDPMNDTAIAEKLSQVMTDDAFRSELEQYGLERAKLFTWDTSGQRAIAALEALHVKKVSHALTAVMSDSRPKLAYISPLPPERSGISDYSAELLPELSHHYDIDVILAQDSVSDPWIKTNCSLRSVAWFKDHADIYDRILYQFGNSEFHQHMFSLLEEVPGIVVLHDFFLSGITAHMDITGYQPNIWAQALYQSHGYGALHQRFYTSNTTEVILRYPCNLGVLQSALGVIVHAQYSRLMAEQWYGVGTGMDWAVIPHLRMPAPEVANIAARHELNLSEDNFIVCSFGMLGPTKLNQRLLDAWLISSLSKNERCLLVFVGENHGGDYGAELLKTIKKSGLKKRICITGWADTTIFRQYLAAADIGVQLRTLSRGETSGTVLDCMNYGLPTIVNANGSMAELPKEAVWMLPDEFADNDMVDALETLWQDSERRKQLATRAREVILTQHDPDKCANQYAQAIESMYQRAATDQHALVRAIADLDNLTSDNVALELLAKSVAASFSPEPSQRQLLFDVTGIVRHDLKSEVERVVRGQLIELIKDPPKGFRVEPVYLTEQDGQWHYRYARSYTCKMLCIEQKILFDAPIDISQGDVFYAPDFFPDGVINAARSGIYSKWKVAGLSINFLVYDLLPVLRPEFFPDDTGITHATWLKTIAEFSSRLICISNAAADELRLWLKSNPPARKDYLMIDVVHPGADIKASVPTNGMPNDAESTLNLLSLHPSFLMLGTVEPRKRHAQALAAFEKLWDQGLETNLVIVGKQGWEMESLADRLRHHSERGKRLFWLEGISDEYLEKIYDASTCLIAASEGEGFGLPLIEAAQHKLPIIARDMPVFREVAGEHAHYFSGLDPESLEETVKNWLTLNSEGRAPQSVGMPWLTWEQSTQQLVKAILFKAVTPITGKQQLLTRERSDLQSIQQLLKVSPPEIETATANKRQLLVDVSNIVRNDLKTGIERVVRAQLMELIKDSPKGFSVEPVYLTDQGGQWHYRYARSYTHEMLDYRTGKSM